MIPFMLFLESSWPTISLDKIQDFLARTVVRDKARSLERISVSISSVLLISAYAYGVYWNEKIYNNSNLSRRYFVDAEWRIKISSEQSTFVYVSRYNLPRRHYTRDSHNAEIRLLDKHIRALFLLFIPNRSSFGLRTKCSVPLKRSSRLTDMQRS